MGDFDWATNSSNGVDAIEREWVGGANSGLQEFCAGSGGYYTIDAEHGVEFDGIGYKHGIVRAVTAHDYK